MINLKLFLVTYDVLDKKAISNLSKEEKEICYAYCVRSDIFKNINTNIKRINEWELEKYNPRYQILKWYEYGAMIQLYEDNNIIKDLTHIGIFHYDIIFNSNSIIDIKNNLLINPNIIHYLTKRKNDKLYFTYNQLQNISEYLNNKMNLNIDPYYIWNNEWISEAMSITPIEIFNKFCKFLYENRYDIENIISSNRWGIMDTTKHRICGFIERLWGIYLVSLNLDLKQMNVIHDWDSYQHKHLSEK